MKTCVLYLLHGEDLVPIWKNSLMTLRKSGYRQKVITYTTIKITPKLRKFAGKFRCRMEPLVIEGFEKDHEYHEVNSQEFNRISYEKFAIMHRALKQKFELVVYVDCDVVFFSNFVPYLRGIARSEPIGAQAATASRPPRRICAGFMYFRNSWANKWRLRYLYKFALSHREIGHDEAVFNYVRRYRPWVLRKVALLSDFLFSTGLQYGNFTKKQLPFMEFDSEEYFRPFLFHANFVVGLEDKVKLFKAIGGWVLDQETEN